ncbi:MAG: protein-tyrosine phosphatase-like protein [Benniella sp.]|nr:MAG: protein-tyrosine phosphatase-like protein [Benniella sp.]
MVSSSSALEDPDLKELSGDTVSELLEHGLDVNGNGNTILLLDMRPPKSHATASIKTAISVSMPNMLLKRPMYTLGMIAEQLTTPREAESFSNWRQFSNIVFFDATGVSPEKGTPIFCVAQKFRREGCVARLGYIHGGYNAFEHEHASLCFPPDEMAAFGAPDRKAATFLSTASASKLQSTPASHTRCRLHLGSLPTPGIKAAEVTADRPTPMLEKQNINPLFENVRQAMGLDTNITEEVSVRLPPRVSIESIWERLPSWLLEAIHSRTGKTHLAENFQRIEVSEKNRLAQVMAPQEIHSDKQLDFSICAGLEKGLKNRYNHVWPFEHNRVRIKECKEGDDDYINASHLKAPFGQGSYIASQAPLPSTFEDFWKVVWEQGSRVIVMLTRETEMGRTKCHPYWPTAEQPVMEFGSVKVRFVTSFRPDAAEDTILVRQMQLSHAGREDEAGRVITQIQYFGWPDFGVPNTPLAVLKVIELAHAYNVPVSAGPMVVHCSAGCGRTGTFCVIDSVLTEIKNHRADSNIQLAMGSQKNNFPPTDAVFATVSKFREQRLSMVQCLRQYVFCYEAILWYLATELVGSQEKRKLAPDRTSVVLSSDGAPMMETVNEVSYFG